MAKLSTRHLIAGLIIIIIVISIVFMGIQNLSWLTSHETLKAIAETDKEFARVGEQINFTAEKSEGDIRSYQWDFGDSTTSKEVNPTHAYEISDWYNVTLTIEDKNGKKVNHTLPIGIQCNDEYYEGESGIIIALRTGRGYAITTEIGPNIGLPIIETNANVYRAVGLIEFEVKVVWELSNDEFNSIEIHTESITAIGENIQFNYDVMPDEIPKDVQKYPSEIWVSVICWEGGWENVLITLNAVFPMQNLNQY